MEKKLILKLKLNGQRNDLIKVKTQDNECNVYHTKDMDKFLVDLLKLTSVSKAEIEKLEQVTKLDSVLELINQGFTIRIDEIGDDHLRFMAFKGNASITFGVSKEQGISKVLIEAEDWAHEFVQDLNGNLQG